MIDQFELYAGTAMAAVIGVFALLFKLRGNKIESLKSDNETLKDNSDKLEYVVKSKQKEIDIREKVQVILTEPDAVFSDMRERMRQRREGDNDNRE